MQPLDKSLRNTLEKTVKDARDQAEAAARAALDQLGVGDPSAPPHLSESERDLRRRLRIHGRQLGDVKSNKGVQEIDRLLEEVAYEHWHRMLFARFLAENNLLMYPDPAGPIPVTLEECEDLAADEGAANGWELASRYASKMLPQIFRPDSPVFELILPPEYQHELERLVGGLAPDVFTASDSLGWVYQYWQAKRKDEVNKSGVKIGARELPSQTQLFTEPYMVSFLLDNSLGAWWAARRLSEEDLTSATSEEELRQKASLPGLPLTYLRFVKEETDRWTPAAGTFEAWPQHLSELKTLDPCCGSGHFLVAALQMLVPIRILMEGITAQEAIDSIIRENLHGLEIDQRCVELAAFALAMTAWTYPNGGGYRDLPELAIACSGLAINAKKDEWGSLAEGDNNKEIALDTLYDLFIMAPTLGSLIDLPKFGIESAIEVDWVILGPLLTKALAGQDETRKEMGVVAQGIVRAAKILSGNYHWIITNVPYLASGKQGDAIKKFIIENYPDAKKDLATAFLERCLKLCCNGGTASIVLPQNWLFLTTYTKLRAKILREKTWHLLARLGSGAFDTISGEVVKAILLTISCRNPVAGYIRGIDVSGPRTIDEKSIGLIKGDLTSVEQNTQLTNPDARIVIFSNSDANVLLSNYSECYAGVLNGDSPHFQKNFWEIVNRGDLWSFQQTTVSNNIPFGGQKLVLFFDMKEGHIREESWIRREKLHDSDQRGNKAWGKWGIAISQMMELPVSLYTGATFDSNIAIIYPENQEHVLPIWTYCQSRDYYNEVRKIDQKLNVTNATLVKVPFDLEYWSKVADEQYPNGLPKPYSDDPTQWIFHGHPAKSDSPLQVAVARLLGYRWPAELDPEMELSDEQWEWVKRCESLRVFEDDDGIVCIPSVRGEPTAADRLLSLLAAAYGDVWNNDILSDLLAQADHAGKTLETWLREKFFIQHCKLFNHRPFIWHIWDGLRDGFSVLVNYHRLDHKTLESLIYTYIGDWITRQKHDIAHGVDGAQEKLDAAEVLKKRLELIHEGESPYDIFVRWKSLAEQPVEWDPDLNDGVRLNIRPFLTVPPVGKKGAGVLRDKPNIKWDKDRGQDVPSAPWYHLGPEYGGKEGDRINDHHLTLEEKKRAREGRNK